MSYARPTACPGTLSIGVVPQAAVQYEGSVQLHDIEGDPEGRNTKTFPDTQDDSGVSSAHLTEQFLIYST
eukprot:287599-Rhodomonas_salina.7